MKGFGVRSKTNYPPKMGYKNGKIPPAQANATQGVTTGVGSSDSYPNAKSGNVWPAPNNYATASSGQTTGHPSQKTTYPGKGIKGSYEDKSKIVSSETGTGYFSPKGGNML